MAGIIKDHGVEAENTGKHYWEVLPTEFRTSTVKVGFYTGPV
jgi:hypothetical protein